MGDGIGTSGVRGKVAGEALARLGSGSLTLGFFLSCKVFIREIAVMKEVFV
jgi:hypothetical protein